MSQCKIISVDLAKDVFEVALANRAGRILEHKRLNRACFRKLLSTQAPALVLFEACGTSHFWARCSATPHPRSKATPRFTHSRA